MRRRWSHFEDIQARLSQGVVVASNEDYQVRLSIIHWDFKLSLTLKFHLTLSFSVPADLDDEQHESLIDNNHENWGQKGRQFVSCMKWILKYEKYEKPFVISRRSKWKTFELRVFRFTKLLVRMSHSTSPRSRRKKSGELVSHTHNVASISAFFSKETIYSWDKKQKKKKVRDYED